MTPAQTVPAVLLWWDSTGALIADDTATAPVMCSPVAEAVDALNGRKATMVAAGDLDAVRAALGLQDGQDSPKTGLDGVQGD